MGMGLIAVAGVLLLGAGVMILVANLTKSRGSSATIDQIQTYGYVAEATAKFSCSMSGVVIPAATSSFTFRRSACCARAICW